MKQNRTMAENAAVEYLRKKGYEILDRSDDLGIVAWERQADMMVFCVVRHGSDKPICSRAFSSYMEREKYAKAVRIWCRKNKWIGSYRVDAIHVYGDIRPVIDHLRNVKMKGV